MNDPARPSSGFSDANLDRALAALRHESAALDAPPRVEKQLLAAFVAITSANARQGAIASAARQPIPRRNRLSSTLARWFAPGVAVAASVGMASWMMLSPLSRVGMDDSTDVAAAIAAGQDLDNPFIALQSLERIALEPTPRLIAANVPRAALAAYGVPINPEVAGQPVRTEMLVAANGQPLAMRFLP